MRTISLLPLTALVAVAAGCGSEAREQAARSVPKRDLTLVSYTSEVKIASPVETQQLRTRAARPAPARRSSSLEPTIAPVLAASEPVAQPAATAPTPDNDRELLPGKTVTVIPASSGPSTGADRTDDFPGARGRTIVTGGGGTCRGRGRRPGIGIATAPRPDFR
jgi:hypothetical protein